MKIRTESSESNNNKKAEGTEAEGRKEDFRFLYSEFLNTLF